jgi:reductive dehalogenase
MTAEQQKSEHELPFPVADDRFDQKYDLFKRALWDEKIQPAGKRFYMEAVYQDKMGFRKKDYALRCGGWNIEWAAAWGNSRSNFGLYTWEGVNKRIQHYVDTGDPVREPPEQMSRTIKRVARYFGADDVGICRLHPNWVYSHEYNTMTREHYPMEVPEGCDNAIVLAVAMDYETIRMSPSGMGDAATGLGYSMMAYVANLLATFIRVLGYRALPCGNDTALSIPMAMAAGLGEVGRMGLLIHHTYGPRIRLCKVITDLPLAYDSYQPIGATEFCEVCKKCAKYCPSQAISEGGMTDRGPNISSHSGVRKWYVDCEKCFNFWGKLRMSCSNCIRVCPFNKPAGFIHDMSRAFIRKTTSLNKFLLWIDDMLGYDKSYPGEKFWN